MSRLARALVLSVCFVASASVAHADTVTANWNANPPADTVTGYVLSYGTTSGGPYTTSIDVGLVTSRQVTLTQAQRYYFVVQAYNSGGLSGYSSQAFADVLVSSVPPAFTTQPINLTLTVGLNGSFSVVATGTPAPTYQWQVSTNGGTSYSNLTNAAPYSGVATPTLGLSAVAALLSGNRYRAVATNSAGSATSNAAILTVNAAAVAPVVTTQPASQTVTAGANASFSVVASGTPAPTYQWQVSTNGGTSFSNLTNTAPYSGVATATLTVTSATTGLTANRYRAVATNSAGSATSTAAILTVNAVVGAPAITAQPTNQTVTVGTNTSFTVAASGTPTYQWQVSTDGGASFSNLTNTAPHSGVTTSTLTLTNVTSGTANYYRAVATNSAGSATSTAATLVIAPVGSSIALVQHAQLVNTGAVTTAFQAFASNTTAGNLIAVFVQAGAAGEVFTVTDSRGNLYQQATQVSSVTNGHTVAIYYAQNIAGGATTVTVTQTISAAQRFAILEYAGLLTSGALEVTGSATGNNATPNSGNASFASTNALVIGVFVPSNDRTITVGHAYMARETVAAAPNSRLLVQDSLLWNSGSLSASATLSSADTWTAVIAIFKGTSPGGGTAPTITTQPTSQTVTAGATASFAVAASGSPVPAYQWQVSTNGGTTFSNLTNTASYSGVTTATLTVTNTTAGLTGNQYRAVATNGAGSATSNAGSLTVNAASVAPVVTTQPTNQIVTAGANASFAVVASGVPSPTYQWQVSTNGGATFSSLTNTAPYSGVTTAVLILSSVTAGLTGNQYRAVATNSVGSATSNAGSLTVNAASVAPVVTTQPANQTVTAGATISFAVVASGTPAPTYQWQVSTNGGTTFSNLTNTAPYSGAATATLTVTSTTTGLTGNQYRAVATNSAGSATSNAAVLTVSAVTVAPVITSQPATQTVTAGVNVSFGVVASGTPTPTYQWQVSTNGGTSFSNLTNAAPYGGVTTATLTVTSATTGLTGNRYRVIATNSAGTATSNAATLTVTAPSVGSIVLVQHAQLVNSGAVTSAVKAFASSNTAGNFVAVAIRGGQSGQVFTVTDTRGNTYQKAVQINQSTDHTLSIYYAQNVAGGANTVTVAQTKSSTLRFAILEYAGVATSVALDVAVAATGSGTAASSGSVATTANGDLVFGVISTAEGKTITATGGSILQESVPAAPATKVVAEDRRQTLAGAASVTATLSSTDGWAAALAAFKAVPAAGGAAALTMAAQTVSSMATQTPVPLPIGSLDAPASGTTNAQGAVALSGWALAATSNLEISRVEIWRDVVAGETTRPYTGSGLERGKIFVALAPLIDGARPDVEALFAGDAHAARAGWGALVLTRGLSSQGDGTYTLYAIGFDASGGSAVLGTTTMTVDNAHATRPFGDLETPGDGTIVSGLITVKGWALTPGASCSIGAASVGMSVDAGSLAPVVYGQPRSNVATAFPGFANSDRAGGAATLDTTTLADGIHQINWSVTDTCGRQAWIGSRFVTVHNTSATLSTSTSASAIAPLLSSLTPVNGDPIVLQTHDRVSRLVAPNAGGVRVVHISQGDHVDIQLPPIGGATYTAYQLVNGMSRALPLGSTVERATGRFAWQPAASFLGSYELVFVATKGDGTSQAVRVRVVVGPSARLQIDQRSADVEVGQPFELTGWALDLAAADGAGIAGVQVWATPAGGGAPIRLGAASTSELRPDVAAVYSDQFGAAGFRFLAGRLGAGTYDVRISIETTDAGTLLSAPVRIVVR